MQYCFLSVAEINGIESRKFHLFVLLGQFSKYVYSPVFYNYFLASRDFKICANLLEFGNLISKFDEEFFESLQEEVDG